MTSTVTNNISPDILPDLFSDPDLMKMIEQDEEFSPTLYKDSNGLNHIGIGFCLDRRTMPRAVALYWLDLIIDEVIQDLGATYCYEIYTGLDRARRFAILNMCYQMGVNGVCHPVTGFKRMWASLKAGEYEEAAGHAIDSDWYRRDTPNRAMRVADVIRTGSLHRYGM